MRNSPYQDVGSLHLYTTEQSKLSCSAPTPLHSLCLCCPGGLSEAGHSGPRWLHLNSSKCSYESYSYFVPTWWLPVLTLLTKQLLNKIRHTSKSPDLHVIQSYLWVFEKGVFFYTLHKYKFVLAISCPVKKIFNQVFMVFKDSLCLKIRCQYFVSIHQNRMKDRKPCEVVHIRTTESLPHSSWPLQVIRTQGPVMWNDLSQATRMRWGRVRTRLRSSHL